MKQPSGRTISFSVLTRAQYECRYVPMELVHAQRVSAAVRAEMARTRTPQASLARALGITQQSVSRRLNGHTPFTLDEVVVAADLLGVDRALLLDPPVSRRQLEVQL